MLYPDSSNNSAYLAKNLTFSCCAVAFQIAFSYGLLKSFVHAVWIWPLVLIVVCLFGTCGCYSEKKK